MPWQFFDPQITQIKEHAPMVFPFMAAAANETKLSMPRIIEAIIIAAVTGGITMWVTVSVISTEIVYVKASVDELKAELKELRRDVYTFGRQSQLNGENNNQRDRIR